MKVATQKRKHILAALKPDMTIREMVLLVAHRLLVLTLIPICDSGSLDVVSSISTFTSTYSNLIALVLRQLCCPMYSNNRHVLQILNFELMIERLYVRLSCVTE